MPGGKGFASTENRRSKAHVRRPRFDSGKQCFVGQMGVSLRARMVGVPEHLADSVQIDPGVPRGLISNYPFLRTSRAARVSASVAVEMTASASGAQNALCSEGNLAALPPAARYLSSGVPPTQKIRLSIF